MKLVIVDDIAANRKLLRATLEAEGHTALEAGDGVEALQVLSSEEVDGVVSDVLMPRMDGYSLCNEIRADHRLRDLPFVFYTATFDSAVDEQLARNVGADKYLTKPASVETILSALSEAAVRQHAPAPGTVREIDVLKGYSDRLVTKLEEKNAELERRLRLSALSIDVGAALIQGKTLSGIVRRCCEAIIQHLDAVSAVVWTYNDRTGRLELQGGAGLYDPADGSHGGLPLQDLRIDIIAHQRKPRLVNRGADGEPWTYFAGYPLIVGERLLGVMALFAPEAFSDAALGKIASIADAIALGVERKRAEEELRSALADKTTLLQEVHHRVKNNLQVIGSLLSLQMDCVDDDRVWGPLNDAYSRVFSVSLVHEQIYQSEALGDLDFGDYVGRLSASVLDAYNVDSSRVDLELAVEAVRLTTDQAVPCGLIVNEFLSNALKHAFKDGRHGTIRISLRETGGRVELAVEDNGVGLPADCRWDELPSFGMKIVRTLVKQLGAELTIRGEGGASFRLSWQLPQAKADSRPVPPPTPHTAAAG